MPLSVLGLSGSTRRPSRTSVLVRAVAAALDARLHTDSRVIELADAAPHLFAALNRAAAPAPAEAILRTVETADILVVATPVYRASYTGALKHLFDLVRHDALAGKPVILAATGGSPQHGLVTEHQLRPLLSFFSALTIPTAIYATEADFDDLALTNPSVLARIDRAADETARFVAAHPAAPARTPIPATV
jgi:FMN reductase